MQRVTNRIASSGSLDLGDDLLARVGQPGATPSSNASMCATRQFLPPCPPCKDICHSSKSLLLKYSMLRLNSSAPTFTKALNSFPNFFTFICLTCSIQDHLAPRSPLFIFFLIIYISPFSYFLHHSALVGDEYLSPHLPSSALCLRRAPRNRPGLEYAGQTVGYNRTPPLPLQHLYDAHNLKQKCRNMHNTPQQHGTHSTHSGGAEGPTAALGGK